MNLFLLFILGISFCNQNIDVNSKVIECHKQLKNSEFNKLKKFREVEILDLSNSNISDLKYIRDLKNLKVLSLENTKINSLNGIEKLIELEFLNLFNTKILNYDKLKYLSNMRFISLNFLNLKILKILANYKKLKLIRTLKRYRKDFKYLNFSLNEYKPNYYVGYGYGGISEFNRKILERYLILDNLHKEKNIGFLIFNYRGGRLFVSKRIIPLIVDYIIEHDIGINTLDEYDNSLLDYAISEYNLKGGGRTLPNRRYNKKLVKLLLKHHALKGKTIVEFRNNIHYFRDLFIRCYSFFKGTSLFTVIKLFKEIKNNGDK